MLTLRRLLVALVATLPVLAAVPATAQPAPLATWIVTFGGVPSPAQLDVLRGVSGAVHGFGTLPAAVVVAPVGADRLLRSLPGVRGVYPNETYAPLSNAATTSTGAASVWQDLGWTGAGVAIAVIDAGVDGTHPDLCAAAAFCRGTPVKTIQNVKVLGRQDVAADPVVYLEDQLSTDSSSGHGSHVAGIAAGYGTAGADPLRYRGVAHGASLVGYGTGEAVEAVNVLAAYDHALEHRDEYGIRVINNSWGPGAFTPYDPGHPVNLATDAAWAAGVSVVFGAGNDGTRTDSLNAFSANPRAISVGGGRKDHQQSFFSSKGVPGHPQLHPTVTAPGELIASARASTGFTIAAADAGNLGGSDPDTPAGADVASYATSSGTSMASPHVAGVVALMQQAAIARRGTPLTPAQVRDVLQTTASPMPGYQHYSVGAGFVDARAAVEAAAAGTSLGAYDDGTAYDVRAFAGAVGPAALVPVSSFSSTHDVAAGARSLDVMVDWGPDAVTPATTDVDLELFRPDGSLFLSTFLRCDPAQQPNGYSSFCSSAPNERLTVVDPAPGRWTAVVRGGVAGAGEQVRGLWSVAYPDGVAPAGLTAAASVAVAASAPAAVAGTPVVLTATVRDAAGLPLPGASVAWGSDGVGALAAATSRTDSRGRVQVTATSTGPGAQVVHATSGTSRGSAGVTWLGVALPELCLLACPPPATSGGGEVSGGGWWDTGGSRHRIAANASRTSGTTATSGELSYDDRSGTTVQGTGADGLTVDGSRATVTGTCTVNGEGGYRYALTVVDGGEPGTRDTVRLVVTKTGFHFEDAGTLGGGNLQVRPS